MKESPQILAFYSFKGGVGRSMAVLNLAYALAAKGRHVLVLDVDLEAPGLSGFLHREAEIAGFARFDMVNLLGWAFSATPPLNPVSFPTATDYVVPIVPERLAKVPRTFSELGRLDIIPVEEERDYYDRLTSLAMGNYDQDDLVRAGSVLRAWLKSLRFPIEVPDYYGPDYERTASYDYVLVDSRTGITETGGLCIGPLSDQLVVLTALNDQNVAGTRKFLTEVGILDERAGPAPGSKPYLVVASLVPTGEIEKKRQRLGQIELSLGKDIIKLSYHPQLALKETIFTRDHKDEYLAREYEDLLQRILHMTADLVDDETLRVTLSQPRTSIECRDAVRQLRRTAWMPGLPLFLSQLISTTDFAKLSDGADYVVWDRACDVLSGGEPSFSLTVINNWANLLSEWARSSKDPELAALRMEAAMTRYEQVIKSTDASHEHIAIARYNRGVRYGQRGEPAKAIADYDVVVRMPDATALQRAHSLVNRGGAFRQLAMPKEAIADFTMAIEMADTPTDIRALAVLNRGLTFSQLSEPEKAVVDYESSIQMLDGVTEQNIAPQIPYGMHYGRRGDAPIAIPFLVAAFQMPDGRTGEIEPKALALLWHGLALNQLARPEKAIASFTALIDMLTASADHKAKARLSRGLAYGQLSEPDKAIADFTAVIHAPDASQQTKAMSRLARANAYELVGKSENAITDYAAVIEMHGTPPDQKLLALVGRGLAYFQRGEVDKAVADLTTVIQMPDVPTDQKATALNFRGLAHNERRESDMAISDYTAVLEIPDVAAEQKSRTLINRGVTYVKQGEFDRAIADYTAVEQMQEDLIIPKAHAVFLRGLTYVQRGERSNATVDFTAVIDMLDPPADLRAKALFIRGLTYGQRGNSQKAIDDFGSVIQMPGDPADLKGNALFIRGSTFSRIGDMENAIADFSAVIAMTAVPDEQKAQALYSRGAAHATKDQQKEAIADFTSVIEIGEISDELKAQALYSRGATHSKQDEPQKAIADYSAVIEMKHPPAMQKAMALCGRGWLRFLEGHYDEAIDDNRQAVPLNPERWVAHANLAIALLANGKLDEALASYDAAVALADIENLDEMTRDLHNLTLKRGQLPGISDVLARIEARKRSLSH
jgi:tetratricopeptide (TPR) repeat protein